MILLIMFIRVTMIFYFNFFLFWLETISHLAAATYVNSNRKIHIWRPPLKLTCHVHQHIIVYAQRGKEKRGIQLIHVSRVMNKRNKTITLHSGKWFQTSTNSIQKINTKGQCTMLPTWTTVILYLFWNI